MSITGTSFIHRLGSRSARSRAGSKAENLRFLLRKGYRIPRTHVCTWDAFERFSAGDAEVLTQVAYELEHALDEGVSYAIRSSANVEDTRENSFAGQFATFLGVQGVGSVTEAIRQVWLSGASPKVAQHIDAALLPREGVKLAVVIQEMVRPECSGVSFGKNPVTGLDEVIVEAVRGSGVALVQEGVTPERWVSKWGMWTQRGDPGCLTEEDARLIVAETRSIQEQYGAPADLEWIMSSEGLIWIQLRQITALRGLTVYSNRISSEVLPGVIKPLVWSVNTPLVNGAWVRLMTEMIGPNSIDPSSLAKAFHYRAYFNMTAMGEFFAALGLPQESLELMMGIEQVGPEKPRFRPGPKIMAKAPRLMLFAFDKAFFSRRLAASSPSLQREYDRVKAQEFRSMSDEAVLRSLDDLYTLNKDAAYFNIVTPLLMFVYNRMLKSALAKQCVDFEDFDLVGDSMDIRDMDPAYHMAGLNERMRSKGLTRLSDTQESWREFESFMVRFGHLSDSGNDFSIAPWREKQEEVAAIVESLTTPEVRKRRLRFEDLPKEARKKMLLGFSYRMARKYMLNRERMGSLYTYGYGLFRVHFLELGRRLVDRGILDSPHDIFYLYLDEVRQALGGQPGSAPYKGLVSTRKADIESVRDVKMPPVIYGDQAPPVVTEIGRELRGLGTSRGVCRGRVRVVRGMEDFSKLAGGDVLVVPYSDVSFTPLFSKAGAVVAESGGLLSHSSIIARECSIPAVVSVQGATSLPDGTVVTVDGYEGRVIVHELLGAAQA